MTAYIWDILWNTLWTSFSNKKFIGDGVMHLVFPKLFLWGFVLSAVLLVIMGCWVELKSDQVVLSGMRIHNIPVHAKKINAELLTSHGNAQPHLKERSAVPTLKMQRSNSLYCFSFLLFQFAYYYVVAVYTAKGNFLLVYDIYTLRPFW